MRWVLVLGVLFLGDGWDHYPPDERCRDMCEVLDMRHVATVGCTCHCKDVDGSEYVGTIPECR